MDIICIELMPFVETGNEISQRNVRNKKKRNQKNPSEKYTQSQYSLVHASAYAKQF